MTDYTGWEIHTGFLGGNLLAADDGGLDLEESCRAYRDALERALREAYPGATIQIEYEANAEGSLPVSLQTTVTAPGEGPSYAGDPTEAGRVAEDVDRIGSEVWERYDWAVPA